MLAATMLATKAIGTRPLRGSVYNDSMRADIVATTLALKGLLWQMKNRLSRFKVFYMRVDIIGISCECGNGTWLNREIVATSVVEPSHTMRNVIRLLGIELGFQVAN